MATEIVFETHSLSEDNHAGRATGWLPGRLSASGRELARELGARHADDGIEVVFSSDLGRAVETVTIAFGTTATPILLDWRLRETNYGDLNGMPAAILHADKKRYLDEPYSGGESWRQAISRVRRFLGDLQADYAGKRVLVIGHVATQWAFEEAMNGVPLDESIAVPFQWKEGWEFRLG